MVFGALTAEQIFDSEVARRTLSKPMTPEDRVAKIATVNKLLSLGVPEGDIRVHINAWLNPYGPMAAPAAAALFNPPQAVVYAPQILVPPLPAPMAKPTMELVDAPVAAAAASSSKLITFGALGIAAAIGLYLWKR